MDYRETDTQRVKTEKTLHSDANIFNRLAMSQILPSRISEFAVAVPFEKITNTDSDSENGVLK